MEAMYVDFSEAFDKIDHQIMEMMLAQIGLRFEKSNSRTR